MIKEHSLFFRRIHQVLDLSLLCFSFFLSNQLYSGNTPLSLYSTLPNRDLFLFLIVTPCIYFLIFVCFSIYAPYRYMTYSRVILSTVKAYSLATAIVVCIIYLLELQLPPKVVLTSFLIGLVLLVLSKSTIYQVLSYHRAKGYNFRRVLIVGSKSRAIDVIRMIEANPSSGYRIVGCLDIEEKDVGSTVYGDTKIIGTLGNFNSILNATIIDEVLFTIPLGIDEKIRDCISFAEYLGKNIRVFPDWQIERLMISPKSKYVFFEDFMLRPSIVFSSISQRQVELSLKAGLDYLLALLFLVLTAPLCLVITIAITMSSRGPVFFRQSRCGLNGREFTMYKFRSMYQDAQERLREIREFNEMDGPVFKLRNDPRITPVGRFLRKTSLDELPQLLNVLKGEMSLVGPRPPIPAEVAQYKDWQRRRLMMKPGLTCTWQVRARNSCTFDDWVDMDQDYINNWSLWNDIKLIMQTIPAVFKARGM